jgi:hypothetical protein
LEEEEGEIYVWIARKKKEKCYLGKKLGLI